jgi:23S rRNA (pseudouridine1915-N3)-methyltransferase
MLRAMMQKITLLSVGKVKTSWIAEGCQVYLDRLKRSFDCTERILDAGSQKEEEEKLARALSDIDGTVIVLDAAGKEYSSEEFSLFIGKEKDTGRSITFVIGGAYGLSKNFKNVLAPQFIRGLTYLSLGKMTFPHEIAKLLLLEQLFRADSILKKTGYHHSI